MFPVLPVAIQIGDRIGQRMCEMMLLAATRLRVVLCGVRLRDVPKREAAAAENRRILR